ncbi:MAG: hypothetical protein ACRCUK_00745, partial [Plesiomonas shigelloides]
MQWKSKPSSAELKPSGTKLYHAVEKQTELCRGELSRVVQSCTTQWKSKPGSAELKPSRTKLYHAVEKQTELGRGKLSRAVPSCTSQWKSKPGRPVQSRTEPYQA